VFSYFNKDAMIKEKMVYITPILDDKRKDCVYYSNQHRNIAKGIFWY